ncbi:MAG: 2-polyprenylphenol 6-hydroxylase [Alphaproteobacteria bacterium 64-11]|nr:2-polyprenylphenol 6-hydroxylase [Alphaproteobacteria bacterium]OJU12207.1 MAG: 2-polyprenylphenol 6-hydroxylase [Alphaproteobacteria bacterium 64-11]
MKPVSSLLRLTQAAAVLSGPLLAFRAGKPDAGERLARAFEQLGPAYIKLGQMLATRPDVVGENVAQALEHLQDRLPPFSEAAARAEIARAFGKPVEQLFAGFGEPIAAASIAQVHCAQTADTPPVRAAVKILRPRIRELFARDLDALAWFARMAETVSAEARRLRPIAIVETLAASVALELDLRMEAAAASELYERTRGEAEFRVPHIDWSRTAETVLTSEWIDGISVRDPAALAAAGRDPKQVAVLVMRSFLTQALRDGFFHADMHPGNLFIDADGRLVAVDFGIMGRLDAGMRRFMAGTLAGFLQRDYRRVAELHYEFAFVPPSHPVETFAQALRAIGEPIFGRSARDVSIARLLAQLFETTRRFDMQAQPQLVLLQKTMVVVEGVCRGLDPDFDIWEAARPVAEKWVHQQMGPEAALTKAAESLGALGKLAQDLPQLVKNAEGLSQMVAEGGVRLHPDTARAIAAEQERRSRPVRVTLLILLALIAASLVIALMHLFG